MAVLFVDLRRRPPGPESARWFRAEKDRLYRQHPQSPIPRDRRPTFDGLAYWPYDPEARVLARFVPDEPPRSLGPVGETSLLRIGSLAFTYHDRSAHLGAYWVEGYGGGLLVPFRDATCGTHTYGGGRYVVDSLKSADHGSDAHASTVWLDFNYAYHPSCAYDPTWECPLAPAENRVPCAVEAGERLGTWAETTDA